jgi:hypothetical protein
MIYDQEYFSDFVEEYFCGIYNINNLEPMVATYSPVWKDRRAVFIS